MEKEIFKKENYKHISEYVEKITNTQRKQRI